VPAQHAHTTVKLSQDARLHNTWHVVFWLLEMQNMTVMEPRNVLLSHCVSTSFYNLYDFDIAFNSSRH